MQLRTYTSLWNVEKRLYRVYDISLPYPVSLKQIGVLFAAGVPWLLLMAILGVPFGPPFGHVIWIAPPVAAAWFGSKPIAEGKTLTDFLFAQVSFYLGPKFYADLSASGGTNPEKPVKRHVHAQVWSETPVDDE